MCSIKNKNVYTQRVTRNARVAEGGERGLGGIKKENVDVQKKKEKKIMEKKAGNERETRHKGWLKAKANVKRKKTKRGLVYVYIASMDLCIYRQEYIQGEK